MPPTKSGPSSKSKLVKFVTTAGEEVKIRPESILRIRPLYEHDSEGATLIDGAGLKLHTDEDWAVLIARIESLVDLAKFTRPDGSPVWVNKAQVNRVRAPLKSELPSPSAARASFTVGGLRQIVRETVSEVEAAIAA